MFAQLFGTVEAFDVNFEEAFESFEWAAGLRLVVVEEVEVVAEEIEEFTGFIVDSSFSSFVHCSTIRPLANRNFPNRLCFCVTDPTPLQNGFRAPGSSVV